MGLRKRAKRSARKVRGWMLRQWFSRTDPRALELVEHKGSLDDLQRTLAAMIARDGIAAASENTRSAIELANLIRTRPSAPATIHVAMVRALGPVDLHAAVRFGESFLPADPEPRNLHTLALHQKMAGNFERAIELLDRIGTDSTADPDTTRARHELRFEASAERELHRLDATNARTIVDDVTASARDDRQLSIVARLLGRSLRDATDAQLKKLLIDQLEALTTMSTFSPETAHELSVSYIKLGYITKAKRAIELATADHAKAAAQHRAIDSLIELSTHGFSYVPAKIPDYTAAPRRVLYVLHSSLPHHSSGYATRTHGLLSGIRAHQWNASGVTRLGYPQDLGKLGHLPLDASSKVGTVTYHRLPKPGQLMGGLPKAEYLAEYADALCAIARRERPMVLHAAADCHNGLAANAAARALGIKSIYEVRGLWEITRGSREPEWMETEYFKMMSALESQAAREADAVVVITRALGNEMIRRGVPAEKITLVPNGVDVDRFVPRPRDAALARKLGLEGKRVIGYIGSIVDYEGLDLLMHAMQRLRRRGVRDVAAMIVGDGAALTSIQALARDLGINDLVVFTGRVPHDEVEAHYSLVDIAPFPRKSLPVTEMVSPLKPLEAMAMNKIVIASDVAALAEMIEPGVNGMLFRKDDIDDLTEVLSRALADAGIRPSSPREWVQTNRSWHHLAAIVDGLYKQLTA